MRATALEVGTHRFSVLPRRLGDRREQIKLLMETREPDAIERHRIDLGWHACDGTELRLVLPSAYFATGE